MKLQADGKMGKWGWGCSLCHEEKKVAEREKQLEDNI